MRLTLAGGTFCSFGDIQSLQSARNCYPIRATHVVAGLDPSHGGPSYSVPRLCKALKDQGVLPTLLAISELGDPDVTSTDAGFQISTFRRDLEWIPVLRSLRPSIGFTRAIRHAANHSTVIHNHGLWLLPNVQAGWAAVHADIPFFVSPRGMLAPEALAFSPTKKRLYWRAVQRNVLQSASCIHATSDQEHDEIRQVGLKNPIAVIPNGIDLPHLPPRVQRPCTGRTALFLGRVHPKKGIERLIRAWALSGQKSDLWKLRIVGPDENGHTSELIRLANTLGLTNISFEGPLFGPDKWNVYRDADVFVLPTMNENFGLTVAESLACGTPVICTKGAPWSGLTTERCGWWTDASVEALASTLASSLSVPRDELHKMGTRGRFWMEREFSWTAVAIKTAAAYAWFITGGERPIFVRTISHHGP